MVWVVIVVLALLAVDKDLQVLANGAWMRGGRNGESWRLERWIKIGISPYIRYN